MEIYLKLLSLTFPKFQKDQKLGGGFSTFSYPCGFNFTFTNLKYASNTGKISPPLHFTSIGLCYRAKHGETRRYESNLMPKGSRS